MRYCVVEIETGVCLCHSHFALAAANALNPGTVYGTGETSQLAQDQAMVRRQKAMALPAGWEMPADIAAKLAAVPTNRIKCAKTTEAKESD